MQELSQCLLHCRWILYQLSLSSFKSKLYKTLPYSLSLWLYFSKCKTISSMDVSSCWVGWEWGFSSSAKEVQAECCWCIFLIFRPQICSWHHSCGRKWRTKEPLDESKRGEWTSWLFQHSENQDHGIWSHHLMANRGGNTGKWQTLFSWAPNSLQMVTAVMKLKDACSLEEKLWPT